MDKRHKAQWAVYNAFMRKAAQDRSYRFYRPADGRPDVAPMPPLLPIKKEWRAAVLEAAGAPDPETAHLAPAPIACESDSQGAVAAE